MATIQRPTRTYVRKEFEATYVEKDALGGLIKWHELVKRDEYDPDIWIETDKRIKKIFVNGYEWKGREL